MSIETYIAAIRPALAAASKEVSRAVVLHPSRPFLSTERHVGLERWLRGWEQCQRLRSADAVVASFGKSGRTWLRVMLFRFYQLEFGVPEPAFGFDNLLYMGRGLPRIFFTHDNYIKDYSGNQDNKADYYDKKVVLLVRHPADVAVSQYHQWRHRMRDRKKAINGYPSRDVSIADFVLKEEAGLAKTIAFLNDWARERDRLQAFTILRYEDLKADPADRLEALTRFLGTPGSSASIEGAVAFASFDNMHRLETENRSRLSGGRMKARDPSNPESFKTRRGKVGGFHDYFSPAEVEAILDHVDQKLDPVFGYRRAALEATA